MKICVVGTGYVGLVSGTCMADVGNEVCCVDKNKEKVEMLKAGKSPIFEPGLEELVKHNSAEGRLTFTDNLKVGMENAEVCFITVDTPLGGDSRADLSSIVAVAKELGTIIEKPVIVVTKSTVPVGTTMKVKEIISAGLTARALKPSELLSMANNPEFLKEGDAVADFMKPDRVVVGVEKEIVGEKLHSLYAPFMFRRDRFIQMNIQSSELTKYAANAMLATRISFVNELARLCERVGADISDIRLGLGSDPRIGPDFLYAGLGFGGSCFPKDTRAIVSLGQEMGIPLTVIDSADRANDKQKEWFYEKIEKRFGGNAGLKGKHIAIWGLAFKANTDDVRYAPALYLIEQLVKSGAKVSAFDPVAIDKSKASLGEIANRVEWCANMYECLKDADALIVCTEWRDLRSPDFKKVKSLMKSPYIFDGRNLYKPKKMAELGFTYDGVGFGGK